MGRIAVAAAIRAAAIRAAALRAAALRAAANVAELTGRPVLAGIQLHDGPAGSGPTVAELRQGLQAAKDAGLPGVAYFRAEMLVTSEGYREAAAAATFPAPPREVGH